MKEIGIPLITLLVEYVFFVPRAGNLDSMALLVLAIIPAGFFLLLYLINVFSGQKQRVSPIVSIALIIAVFGILYGVGTYHPGVVQGVVRDDYGNPIAGITITIIDSAKVKHQVTTDAYGQYVCIGLPAGLTYVYHAGQEPVQGVVFGDLRGYFDRLFTMPGSFNIEIPIPKGDERQEETNPEYVSPSDSTSPDESAPAAADLNSTEEIILTEVVIPPTPLATPYSFEIWKITAEGVVNCRTCAYSDNGQCPIVRTFLPNAEVEVIAIVEGGIPRGYNMNLWLQVKHSPRNETELDICYVYRLLAKKKP